MPTELPGPQNMTFCSIFVVKSPKTLGENTLTNSEFFPQVSLDFPHVKT